MHEFGVGGNKFLEPVEDAEAGRRVRIHNRAALDEKGSEPGFT